MFSPFFSSSFIVLFKGHLLISLVICLHRPTHFVLHVPLLLLCVLNFKKLPLCPPLLFELQTGCFVHWCQRKDTLHFPTLIFFVSPFCPSCFLLLHSSSLLLCWFLVLKTFPTCPSSFLKRSAAPAHRSSARLGPLGPYFSRFSLMLISSQK